jgi:hypothetical protein
VACRNRITRHGAPFDRTPAAARATTATGLARTTHLATCMFNFDTGDRELPWSIGAHFIIGGCISMSDRP